MTIQRMEHVGIVVVELAAARSFFVELGLKLQGEGKEPLLGGAKLRHYPLKRFT